VAFLAPFQGAFQADAYSGYDALYQSGRVIEVGCWAHVRRGFVEAFMIDTAAALMIALIQQLYQVEQAAANLDPDGRRALRQEQSAALLMKIDAERQALARTVLPKSPLGEAVRYLTNQWAALQRFVNDGRLAIDNNRAENMLRIVAVGRKKLALCGQLRRGSPGRAPLFPCPELQTRQRRAFPVPQGCLAPAGDPPPSAHRSTDAQTLGHDLRPAAAAYLTGSRP
jgi:Transposase IS66 family